MNNHALKEEFQDEIWEPCVLCGASHLAAYWDEELESYIYLVDPEPDFEEDGEIENRTVLEAISEAVNTPAIVSTCARCQENLSLVCEPA